MKLFSAEMVQRWNSANSHQRTASSAWKVFEPFFFFRSKLTKWLQVTLHPVYFILPAKNMLRTQCHFLEFCRWWSIAIHHSIRNQVKSSLLVSMQPAMRFFTARIFVFEELQQSSKLFGALNYNVMTRLSTTLWSEFPLWLSSLTTHYYFDACFSLLYGFSLAVVLTSKVTANTFKTHHSKKRTKRGTFVSVDEKTNHLSKEIKEEPRFSSDNSSWQM